MYNEKIIEILNKKEHGINGIYEDYLERYKKNRFDGVNYYTLYGMILALYGCGEINKELKNSAINELIYLNEKKERSTK